MARYICTIPCWHGKRKWRMGDIAEFSDEDLPRDKKGNVVHFRPAERIPASEKRPNSEMQVNVNEKPRKIK